MKSVRVVSSTSTSELVIGQLELVHTDMCGP
jgi:hypothetical protein